MHPEFRVFRPIFRRFLPDVPRDNTAAILAWDLESAISRNQSGEIGRLISRGAKIGATAFLDKLASGRMREKTALDVLAAPTIFEPEDLEKILIYAITQSQPLLDTLLSPDRAVKPTIGFTPLSECMTKSKRTDKYVDVFERLLEIAREQPQKVNKPIRLRNMAVLRYFECFAIRE